MSAPMKAGVDANSSPENVEVCEIEATVVTGFEALAKDEVREKLKVETSSERGKLNFKIPVEMVEKILDLQSVDNLFVIVKRYPTFKFDDTSEAALKQIYDIIPEVDWDLGLRVWGKFFSFPHQISPHPKPKDAVQGPSGDATSSAPETNVTPDDGAPKTDISHETEAEPEVKKPKVSDPNMPSFRATCYRSGEKLAFQSPRAAAEFGGSIQDYFGWNVNLKNFDIEAVLTIEGSQVYVSIALTKESLHKRNLVQFGPTSLRPTIAYGLLRLCQIQPGDVVCDPMCGGGTIPIEATLNWPTAHHLCGDMHEQAVPRTAANMEVVNLKRISKGKTASPLGILRWDASNLPLKDNSVDVFLTDMPFGKRSGSRVGNWQLYPSIMRELARVCKVGTGRACLLTHDKKCILKSMHITSAYWRRGTTVGINLGGLVSAAYVLYRTHKPVSRGHAKEDDAKQDT